MKKKTLNLIARSCLFGLVLIGNSQLQAGISGRQSRPGVVPSEPGPLELTYSALSRAWWLADFLLPAAVNPTVTPGADCAGGQPRLLVWFLWAGPASVDCVVPPGRFLFFPIANTECSNLEAPPFYGLTAADRRACAKGWIDNLTNLSATVDGVPIHDLEQNRVQTGDFPFSVPANNILGVAGPASGQSSGDGYYLLLTPLSPSRTHTIRVTGTFHDPNDPAHPVIFPLDTVITVTVGR